MARAIRSTTFDSGTPATDAAVHTAESPSCSPAMPPQACPKSPSPLNFSSAVEGEWSVTMMSMVPSISASHRASRLAASRIGGAHLKLVAASGTCSLVSER